MTEKEQLKENNNILAADVWTMHLFLFYVQEDVLKEIQEEKLKQGK